MNLKEAFRYQSFLERMLYDAQCSIGNSDHRFLVTKYHKCHDCNEDAADYSEEVDFGEFYSNDSVIKFMVDLVEQRSQLCLAIDDAKEALRSDGGIDIDAAISKNKFAQRVVSSISNLLTSKGSTKIGRETGYKFNVDGNQTPYYYTVETVYKENFDRASAKSVVKKLTTEADASSTAIDEAMIRAEVNFTPVFDVNSSFEDAMEEFIAACDSDEKV